MFSTLILMFAMEWRVVVTSCVSYRLEIHSCLFFSVVYMHLLS